MGGVSTCQGEVFKVPQGDKHTQTGLLSVCFAGGEAEGRGSERHCSAAAALTFFN